MSICNSKALADRKIWFVGALLYSRNDISYPLASMTVSVRVFGMSHRGVLARIVHHAREAVIHAVISVADKAYRSHLYTFGAFGGISHDKDRNTERRSFFLYSAAVSQHEIRSRHDVMKFEYIERSYQLHLFKAIKRFVCGSLDLRIGMYVQGKQRKRRRERLKLLLSHRTSPS